MAVEVTPGTMSAEEIVALSRKHSLYEWSAQSAVDPIPVSRAEGIYFYTPDGKRYIDFNSQLMSVNIGHGDKRVIQAIKHQADVLMYANPFMATEPRARLSAKLAELTPGDIDVFFYTNGGAEANENAIKLARQFTGRQKIMVRYRSYHGATGQAIVATGDPRRWAAETGVAGFVRFPDSHKWGRKDPEPVAEAGIRLNDAQWRIFEPPGGLGPKEYVLFWHLVGSQLYDYGDRFNATPAPVQWWRDTVKYAFSGSDAQYFIRVTSNRDFGELAGDPAWQRLLTALAELGLKHTPGMAH